MKKLKQKKSIIMLTLSLLTSLCYAQTDIWDGTKEPWTHGTGIAYDPYLIESAENLAYLAECVNINEHFSDGKYFKQTINIDLNSIQWIPIGYYTGDEYSNNYSNSFEGNYDGNGHTISNLYNNIDATSCFALFGCTKDATISNLRINGVESDNGSHVAGFIGLTKNTIMNNCGNIGEINSVGTATGIIFSRSINSNCTLTDCYNSGKITGTSAVGIFRRSLSYDDGYRVSLINCYNSGNIIATNGNAAGIFHNTGYNDSYVFENCCNTGKITASENASGLILESFDVTMNGCYNTGEVNAKNAAGLIFLLYSGNINNSYNSGKIVASENAGGVVNSNSPDPNYSNMLTVYNNCYNIGEISGSIFAGGIIGSCNSLFGTNELFNCFNLGQITSNDYAGGLIGSVDGMRRDLVISGCYNNGSIQAENVGGLISKLEIDDEETRSFSILNSYNAGILTGTVKGAIVGYVNNIEEYNVNYTYFLDSCGGSNDNGGEAKSESFMKSDDFVDLINTDMEIPAWIKDATNINSGYPIFEWQLYLNIDEFDTDTDCQLSIYPNPANNYITISDEEIEEVSIYNITGQFVKRKMFFGNDTNIIELNDLSSGIYIFKVTLKDGRSMVRKVVVEH